MAAVCDSALSAVANVRPVGARVAATGSAAATSPAGVDRLDPFAPERFNTATWAVPSQLSVAATLGAKCSSAGSAANGTFFDDELGVGDQQPLPQSETSSECRRRIL